MSRPGCNRRAEVEQARLSILSYLISIIWACPSTCPIQIETNTGLRLLPRSQPHCHFAQALGCYYSPIGLPKFSSVQFGALFPEPEPELNLLEPVLVGSVQVQNWFGPELDSQFAKTLGKQYIYYKGVQGLSSHPIASVAADIPSEEYL